MKKIFPFIFLLLCPCAFADIIDEGYVSPESYAVNEADLLDYRYVEPSPKLNVDTLESMRFKKEDTDGNISSDKKPRKKKNKKQKKKKPKKKKIIKKELYIKVQNGGLISVISVKNPTTVQNMKLR